MAIKKCSNHEPDWSYIPPEGSFKRTQQHPVDIINQRRFASISRSEQSKHKGKARQRKQKR